jgi:hypothetical protein
MRSFWFTHWTTVGGLALVALAGAVSLCTWAPGCFLSAAPAKQTTPPKQSTQTIEPSRGETMFRPPDIALLGYDRLAGLYSQAET